MALPFYNQGDQDIYAGGQHFIPQEQYRLGYTAPPTIMGQNTNAGITNTQAAGSYMGYPSYEAWLLAQGGGGSGNGGPDPVDNTNRGGINFNLGPTNITDYEADAYGVGPTWGGSWARAKDAYSKLPTPTNILMKGIDKYKNWRAEKEEEEEAKAQIHRDRINQKIISTGIYKKDYVAPGAGKDIIPSGDGANIIPPADGTTGEGGQGTGSPDGGAQAAGDLAGGSWDRSPFVQGGRIGYGLGDIVKGWFSGGPKSETNPTLFGTQNSLMNKTAINNLENAISLYETQIENADQLGHLSKEDMLKYELAKKQLEALIAGSKGQAEGGLIGYSNGGIAGLL